MQFQTIIIKDENIDDSVSQRNTISINSETNLLSKISSKATSNPDTNTKYSCKRLKTKHPEIAGSRKRRIPRCIHCNKTFASKQALDGHIIRRHPDFIASVSAKVHECTKCTYKTVNIAHLKRHIKANHPDIADSSTTNSTTKRCIHCIKTFASNQSLDDHIVKRHPDFIESVFKKVHECTKCTFKTITTRNLKRHILAKHPDIAGNRVTITCIYCNKTFIRKDSLEDHIVKRHPDFIASVSRKVHECTECTFKTISNSQFRRHMVTHSDRIPRCIHCNKTFASKQALDGHIIRKHPEFIASVSAKVHECTKCTYKTVNTIHLKRHIKANHPDIADNSTTKRCIHCNRTFASKQTLDDHIVKRHPDFITSVSGKVHECTKCTYKTANTTHLKEHILAGNRVTSTCIYCNKTFVRKETLNDHIVKSHPDFIASVSKKVHECTKCSFKTISASNLKEHILAKHPDIAKACIYCNKTFVRKATLDDHIVKMHPHFIASFSRKVHECTKCTFKTISTSQLRRHMVTHSDNVHTCIYCNKTFVRKETLDDHIVRTHPDFIASVSRKVHECTRCTYKTVRTSNLKEHIMAGSRITNRCIYCYKTFIREQTLDDHIVKRHPDFIASVSRKVHQCTKCTYKTVIINHLKEHMMTNHPADRICIQCNAMFKEKGHLQEHIVQKHPEFITSVTSRIHECTMCNFKTISNDKMQEHLLKHTETGYTCMHCSTAFKTDYSLNEHIIKKHPKFIASITRKIHACTKCTFKTVYTSSFQCHLLKHPETAATCIHCNEPFKSITMLDEHIIKKHPSSIPSITRKIHKCTTCDFNTTILTEFKRHQLKHTDRNSNICVHCNKSFLNKTLLDDHIVKKHPSFIYSVTSKIRECTKCSYKTTIAGYLKRHMSHCNAAFTRQEFLNEHILQIHPQFTASITQKLKHTDAYINRNSNICVHCNKSFLSKTLLDDHIVKKHPSFIYSVTSKIRECTKCSYKTTIAGDLKKHMMQHPDLSGGEIFNRCMYCDKTFIHKRTLGEHIIKNHPSYISSVTNKIHECTKCNFKTVDKRTLRRHGCQNVEVTELVLS
nr:unnamed protein product [Callosobruchus analis]